MMEPDSKAGLTISSVRTRNCLPAWGSKGRSDQQFKRASDQDLPLEPNRPDHAVQVPFDRDHYDGSYAEHLVANDPLTGERMASLRLLRTDRPHPLGAVFPDLCAPKVPAGPAIREITQLFLGAHLATRERHLVSRQLATALVEYGLLSGITAYTIVMELAWTGYARSMGWTLEPLGLGKKVGEALIGAFKISIAPSTINSLRSAGAYIASDLAIVAPGGSAPGPEFMALQGGARR